MYELHTGRGSSHRLVAALARRSGRSPILDVGAGAGFLGRQLTGTQVALDAVEPDDASARVAEKYYRAVYREPAETFIPRDAYGVMVFGDVLEHLISPEKIVARLLGCLTPDGIVLVSLPNIAHFAVRLLLLSGRFPSMDRGILDRTHLHFYTRTTGAAMLERAGLRVLECHPTIVPLPDLMNRKWKPLAMVAQSAQLIAAHLAPGLFAHQWVFVAVRREQGMGSNVASQVSPD